MKNVYWRPSSVPRMTLLLIALLSIVGLLSVEVFKTRQQQPNYKEKIKAAHLANEAFRVIKDKRLQLKIPIDKASDIPESGLIGTLMTPVTSNSGTLSAKQTAVNANFAAVVVQMLKNVDVEARDIIAIGFSGSFPSINACVVVAAEILKLRPIIVTSASASSWGANIPDFLWIDMEKALFEKRIISSSTQLASIGGVEDRGIGMSKNGINFLKRSIEKNGIPFLDPATYSESVERRVQHYLEAASGDPIKAYINVGGGTTSVGTKIGKRLFHPGLNLREPIGGSLIDSVMTRMIKRGIPVIHFTQIEKLAKRYGLPIQPQKMPIVGEGKIFYRKEYNTYLTGGILATILLLLYIFVQSDIGLRIMNIHRRQKKRNYPEPMV